MEAYKFLLRHSQELSEKYPGKYLAIVDKEVVGISSSSHEAYEKAKAKYPDKEVHISYMPTDEEMVTLL
ncbi:MAG: hypothetical protein DIAAKJNI_00071 [Candidatus Argoarchaeum ethanivorans]|uniref:DUF5678 domain-containing protein n=1 Tax=Candidatus Argoarchaeum ethanivorans TaxID=2608793 RepID=A0A811T6J0_9EURY|nr:MAG: hypothetical protein DIAAKJNI_00071 [Candidatus Argoarchaeum ethanivorans]